MDRQYLVPVHGVTYISLGIDQIYSQKIQSAITDYDATISSFHQGNDPDPRVIVGYESNFLKKFGSIVVEILPLMDFLVWKPILKRKTEAS